MKTTIDQQEAQEILATVEQIERKSTEVVFAQFTVVVFMLWGAIWFIQFMLGFLFVHHQVRLFGLHPDAFAGILQLIGMLITIPYCVIKIRGNPIRSEGTFFERFRAPLLPLVWFAFNFAMRPLLHFERDFEHVTFDVCYYMMLFIVYGFWFSNATFLTVGAVISLTAILAFWFAGSYYPLCMAIFGGGTLFCAGLYSAIKSHTSGAPSRG